MLNGMAYSTALTGTLYKSGFQSTEDTPYLGLTGELWGVFFEDFFFKLTAYSKSNALYIFTI